ncbi:MAG: hypothetical protein GXP22_09045 [Gammaproteobacteria bacterium]|nr:hypothetical protein [Gammaproteobacteria bacterium]
MNQRWILPGVILGSLLILVLALSMPRREHNVRENLPWQIELTSNGLTRVFGLVIGESSLRQFENQFKEPAAITMFVTETGDRVVEAYFDRVLLSEIRAKVIVVIDVNNAELDAIYARGERIAKGEGGERKVTLSSADIEWIYRQPVASVTYLPGAGLNADLLLQRFGEPASRVVEEKAQATHWLYPKKGLDILLSDNGKVVLQYLPPKDFARVSEPLK